MMKVLILGANGLIGSNIVYSLAHNSTNDWEIFAVCRPNAIQNFTDNNIKVLTFNNYFDEFAEILSLSAPDLVINCVGIVSQNFWKTDERQIIKWNSNFPKFMQKMCDLNNIKCLNISTDCVFAPESGDNFETSTKFASDLYAQSKLLGEIQSEYARTVRLHSSAPTQFQCLC